MNDQHKTRKHSQSPIRTSPFWDLRIACGVDIAKQPTAVWRLYLIPLLLILPATITAQTLVTGTSFTPPSFYVGDNVELSITLAIDNNLELKEPTVYPLAEWIEIHSIRVEQTDNDAIIYISFTPFAAGTRILPPLDFGSILLNDIKITIQSLLNISRPESRQLQGQLLIPGTRLTMAIFLALASVMPFFLLAFVKLTLIIFQRAGDVFRFHRPLRHLRRLVKRLRADLGAQSPGQWYAQLTEGLRIYLGFRLHRDCRTATTAEIAAMKAFSVADTPQYKLLILLKEADMVKFAGQKADERTLRQALYTVETESLKLEKMHARIQ